MYVIDYMFNYVINYIHTKNVIKIWIPASAGMTGVGNKKNPLGCDLAGWVGFVFVKIKI